MLSPIHYVVDAITLCLKIKYMRVNFLQCFFFVVLVNYVFSHVYILMMCNKSVEMVMKTKIL